MGKEWRLSALSAPTAPTHRSDDLVGDHIGMRQDVVGREAEHHPPLPDKPILTPSVVPEHLRLAVEFAAVDLDDDPRLLIDEITRVRTDRVVGLERTTAEAELSTEYPLGFRRGAEGRMA